MTKYCIFTDYDHLHHLFCFKTRWIQFHITLYHNVAMLGHVSSTVYVTIHFVLPKYTILISETPQLSFRCTGESFYQFLHYCFYPSWFNYFYICLVQHCWNKKYLWCCILFRSYDCITFNLYYFWSWAILSWFHIVLVQNLLSFLLYLPQLFAYSWTKNFNISLKKNYYIWLFI